MRIKSWNMLPVIVLLVACQQAPPALPKGIPAWNIGAVSPSLYPARVSRAYGINESQDWTSLLHNFLGTGSSFDNIHPHKPHYQGYALPLGIPVQMRYQIRPAKVLPDILVVEWSSVVTHRRFATRLKLTDALKQRMNQKRHWQLDQYKRPQPCYMRTVVFGLLPDGRARVWLHDCGYYEYLTTLAPYGEQPIEGGVFTQDNQLPDWLQKTKAKFGVAKLFPIPWDKLNRIDPWDYQTKYESQQPDYPGHPIDGTVELNTPKAAK